MKQYIDKIKDFFQKINYWHWWNKKLFENKIQLMSKIFKVLDQRVFEISNSFRSVYGWIIAWTIWFLWFILKDWIINNYYFKISIFSLMIFIVFWIIWLVFSYLLDFIVLKNSRDYINKKQLEFLNYKKKIEKFDFWKTDSEKSNNSKFEMPKYMKSYYFISFIWCISLVWLIVWLITILIYFTQIIFK